MGRSRVPVAVGIYAVFAVIAVAWRHAAGASALHDGHPLADTHAIALPLAASLGALTGVACGVASRVAARRSRWGRGLYLALRDALADHPRGAAGVAALTLAAAIGEELLFRGALLPAVAARGGAALGLVTSALAFGLLHAPWSRRMVPWTVMATAMGAVFGLLYLATGEVLAPIVAHAVANHESLAFLLAREAPAPERYDA